MPDQKPTLEYESEKPPVGTLTSCSFCGRSNRETGRQVEGPRQVYICDRCANTAVKLLRQGRKDCPKWSVRVAVCLMLFPLVPFVGSILQIRVIFIVGGMATFVSLICAIAGLIRNIHRAGIQFWAMAVGSNLFAACYFYWLFFVDGLP
jgi:hypothetical protein